MVHANDTSRDESDLAAKQRFDSFRMSAGLTPTSNLARKRPSSFHGRSHSRTSSISSPSLSVSVSANSIKSTNDMSSVPQPPISKKRPISHHRRRSSVSTRTESADLMGVSVPDLPVSSPKDNLNFGEKDSIRRRALLALEGKPDYTVATVEIPELTTPDLSKSHFEFPTKPSFPPGNGTSLGAGLNSLTGKRDSFKLLSASASSKDQLQTLVEEEEEDDEGENKEHIPLIIDEPDDVLPSSRAPVKTAPSKPRPVGLTLRPLALALDTCVTAVNGLPTPTSTPTPLRNPPKALALVAGNATSDITPARRHSLASNSSSAATYAVPAHRPSLNGGSEHTSCTDEKVKRRSSISYKTSGRSAILSLAGLPTPDGTPTIAERRQSNSSSSSDEDFFHRRPLSVSEQHFLFKSHNALLARITDLEHALSSRHPPYLPSAASDVSSEASEPNDEMLQLVADLKAERDELKRDVDGWRNRVNDLEHQLGLFAKRLEAERRDAWVARSRAGLLEVEKSSLEKALTEQTRTVLEASSRCDSLQAEFEAIKKAMSEAEDRWSAAQAECSRLTKALEAERHRREGLEKDLDRAELLATPTARSFGQHTVAPSPLVAKLRGRGLGFTSMDSESSATDVELPDEHSFKLRAVMEEEEEDDGDISESDNGLAGYEDEDDLDLSVQSPVTSSLGSVDDFRQVLTSPPSCNTPVSTQTLTPSTLHSSHRSLSTPWTFPIGRNVVSPAREPEKVDRFFECLDDGDSSPPLTARVTHEGSKGLFSMGFSADDDDMPPFLLPNDVGVEVIEEPAVPQEEEPRAPLASAALADVELPDQENHIEVEDVFEEQEINGIRIMVTSPLPEDDDLKLDTLVAESPVKKPVPLEDEADDQSFNFGQSTPPKVAFSPPNRNYNSLSSIPRPASRTRFTFDKPSTSPTGSVTGTPIKRSTSPSMIPQPVSSPPRTSRSPYRAAPTTTFTRQPQRKTVPVVGSQFVAGVIHGSTSKPVPTATNERPNVPPTRSPNFGTPGPRHPRLEEKEKKTNVLSTRSSSIPVHEYPENHGSSPSLPGSPITSFMSSKFATRLSFQTFTSFMPRSWGPRSSVAAAANCLMMPSSSTSSSFGFEDEPTTPPPNVVERREPRYVSKQKQLEKLRSRLDLEHTKGSGTGP